jgi:acyl-CoA reductase-like NAD-dependent aldehyde dehydrogenase
MITRCEILYGLAGQVLADDNILIDSQNLLRIKKEPIGISCIISPWNYPLLCAVGAMIPSILCGSPVLLKHSPRTPITGNHFEQAFKSTGAAHVVQHLFLRNDDVPEIYKIKEVRKYIITKLGWFYRFYWIS